MDGTKKIFIKEFLVNILFLDDDISRVDQFQRKTSLKVDHVTNVPDFIAALQNKVYDLVMLDHDLGNDDIHGTGNDAAKYLAANRSLLGDNLQVIIHSANSCGVANMVASMKYAEHLRINVVNFAWHKCQYTRDRGLLFTIY